MEAVARDEIIKELKMQWKELWWERIDDRARAEGIANHDYSGLFVDKGTVIVATRDYKPLNFREILEMHKLFDVGKFVSPPAAVGGWGKFIRTSIACQKGRRYVCKDIHGTFSSPPCGS